MTDEVIPPSTVTDPDKIVTVLEPHDEYTHEPDDAVNYNESMYLNAFDLGQEVGGWFRLGNRVNEGYAEMSVCIYLPDGRVGFMFGRPEIDHERRDEGGRSARSTSHEPFQHLSVHYEGTVCLLDDPARHGRSAHGVRREPARGRRGRHRLARGVADVRRQAAVRRRARDRTVEPGTSFAKAHYEQHCRSHRHDPVGDEAIEIDGLGLRDKSWGPRYWQASAWYRWLPIVFGDDFAMMLSIIAGGDSPRDGRHGAGRRRVPPHPRLHASSPTGTTRPSRRRCAAGRRPTERSTRSPAR